MPFLDAKGVPLPPPRPPEPLLDENIEQPEFGINPEADRDKIERQPSESWDSEGELSDIPNRRQPWDFEPGNFVDRFSRTNASRADILKLHFGQALGQRLLDLDSLRRLPPLI